MAQPERDQHWVVDMEAELAPLHRNFIENRWQDLSRWRAMIKIRDFSGLRELGHSLLGPPGAFGYDYLVEMGRELQSAAQREDREAARELADQYELFMTNHEVRLVGPVGSKEGAEYG